MSLVALEGTFQNLKQNVKYESFCRCSWFPKVKKCDIHLELFYGLNQSEALLVENTGGKRLTSPSENTLLCKEKPTEKLVFVKLGFMGRKNNTRENPPAVLSEFGSYLPCQNYRKYNVTEITS